MLFIPVSSAEQITQRIKAKERVEDNGVGTIYTIKLILIAYLLFHCVFPLFVSTSRWLVKNMIIQMSTILAARHFIMSLHLGSINLYIPPLFVFHCIRPGGTKTRNRHSWQKKNN